MKVIKEKYGNNLNLNQNQEIYTKIFERNENCNTAVGNYLLLLSPEVEELDKLYSNKKSIKRKTDYIKGWSLSFYQKHGIVWKLEDQLANSSRKKS